MGSGFAAEFQDVGAEQLQGASDGGCVDSCVRLDHHIYSTEVHITWHAHVQRHELHEECAMQLLTGMLMDAVSVL
eukprot:8619839-Prorocentrum_lima.AAC.1